jgi:predicted nucleic-acid-binding protein
VNVVIDTNILIRAIIGDDKQQQQAAARLFEQAQNIVIPTLVLCETVWVLRGRYKIGRQDVAERINALAESDKVILADDEVRAGLELLEAGGDFADGVAAYTGRKLLPGSLAIFASFDQSAVRLLSQRGHSAFVPS